MQDYFGEIKFVYDGLAEIFYEATEEDAEEWLENDEKYPDSTCNKYLVMMKHLDKVLKGNQGKTVTKIL